MIKRLALIALALISLISLFVSVSNAGDNKIKDMKKQSAQVENNKALVADLVKGKKTTANGEEYVFLPELKSAKQIPSSSSRQTLSMLGASSDEALLQKGKFLLFKQKKSKDEPSPNLKTLNDAKLYPVVFNERTSQFGIVLGTIEVKYKSGADPQAIGKDQGLALKKDFKRLNTAYYTVKEGIDIFNAAEDIKSDGDVIDAQVEILENIQEPL